MGESVLNRIIQTGSTTPPDYVRLSGVPNGESIIANSQVINNSVLITIQFIIWFMDTPYLQELFQKQVREYLQAQTLMFSV